jgi:arabinogalactan oligomer/maltooligosaccharide transport system substrate-binding protein
MRRLPRLLAVTAGVALLASACGGGGDGGDTAEPQSTGSEAPAPSASESGAPVRADADLVIWADQKRTDALTDVAKSFGEKNGITVAVQTVATDLQPNFVTANTAGNGPDIVIGAHDWIGNLVQNGAIDPVPLSQADQGLYSDIALKGVTYNGQIYGLPYAVESIALYRNTDLVPDAPASIEALAEAGKASGAENPLCLQVGENGDAYHMQPLYTSAGGYLFGTTPEGDYDPNDLGVGKEGSIAAANKISELGKAGVLKTSISGDNSISLFTEGKCAFLVSGPWALTDVQKAGINYEITPIPGFEGMQPAQPFTGVQAFYIASKGANKAFAQQFVLDAANSPETMKALFDAEPRPPAMTAVLDQVVGDNPDVAQFAKAAAGGQILPAIPQMAAVWEPLGKAEAAIVGGADPASTMQTAGQTIADALQ